MFCVPKALKDSDQVAQSDGEESPAAEEQLLGEVLIFFLFNYIGKVCYICLSHIEIWEICLTTCARMKLGDIVFLEIFGVGVYLLV